MALTDLLKKVSMQNLREGMNDVDYDTLKSVYQLSGGDDGSRGSSELGTSEEAQRIIDLHNRERSLEGSDARELERTRVLEKQLGDPSLTGRVKSAVGTGVQHVRNVADDVSVGLSKLGQKVGNITDRVITTVKENPLTSAAIASVPVALGAGAGVVALRKKLRSLQKK